MNRVCNVLIIEDDFYANNWMEMLLRRDWRTRVVGQVRNPVDLPVLLKELHSHKVKANIALIDTDIPQQETWLPETLKMLMRIDPQPTILFTGVMPNVKVVDLWTKGCYGGYILKSEIRFALAWAISLAIEGRCVVTAGTYPLLRSLKQCPARLVILDGKNPIAGLTPHETEIARLAFIFSMERKDLADELSVSEGQINNQISEIYKKIGLKDIFSGEVDPFDYYGSNPVIKSHLEVAFREFKESVDGALRKKKLKSQAQNASSTPILQEEGNKKIRLLKNQETLAFHLITLPGIQEA